MPISMGMDVGGMLSGYLQYQAQQQANQIAWRNLMNQERWNKKILGIQMAPRKNAAGDEIRYVPGLGWQSLPAPMTKKIMDSESREILASLMEDAPRNREQARRKESRSLEASEEYEKAFNKYKYRPEITEGGYIADATHRALRDQRKGKTQAANMLAKIMMRQGASPQQLTSLYEKTAMGLGDQLSDAMAQARRIGKAEYNQDLASREGRQMSELEFLRAIANDTTAMQPKFTRPGDAITGRMDGALAALTAAMQGAQGASAKAYEFAAEQFGNGPKFSGNMSFSGGGDKKQEATERYKRFGRSADGSSGWEQVIDRPWSGNTGEW